MCLQAVLGSASAMIQGRSACTRTRGRVAFGTAPSTPKQYGREDCAFLLQRLEAPLRHDHVGVSSSNLCRHSVGQFWEAFDVSSSRGQTRTIWQNHCS